MFAVSFDDLAGGNGLQRVFVDPHPVHRIRRHVGYCRHDGWSLIVEHDLRESDLPLLTDYVERHLADQRTDSGS